MYRALALLALFALPGCYDAHARPAPAPAPVHGNGACCLTCHTDELERFGIDPEEPCSGSSEIPAAWLVDGGVGGDAAR